MQQYTFIDNPQKAIIVDNYCDNFEELTNNFPNIQSSKYSAFDKNLEYNKKIWIPFIQKHIGKEYLEYICDLVEDHLMEWRPKLLKKIRSGNYTIGPRRKNYILNYEEGEDIMYDFKFGSGGYGNETSGQDNIFNSNMLEGLPIHVDVQNKIFQTMIYFPCIGDDGVGGDIHLTKLDENDNLYDTVKCVYKENRALIFPHHPAGWHFVTPRKSNFPRRGVGVIYTVKESLQEISPELFGKSKLFSGKGYN
jgi:hypothetical protein